MNFLKKHWLAITLLLIVAIAIYRVVQFVESPFGWLAALWNKIKQWFGSPALNTQQQNQLSNAQIASPDMSDTPLQNWALNPNAASPGEVSSDMTTFGPGNDPGNDDNGDGDSVSGD